MSDLKRMINQLRSDRYQLAKQHRAQIKEIDAIIAGIEKHFSAHIDAEQEDACADVADAMLAESDKRREG